MNAIERIIMEIEKYYMTPQEFADTVVQILEDSNSFKKNQKAHPVDIEVAFSSAAFAVASGIDSLIKNNKSTFSSNNYRYTPPFDPTNPSVGKKLDDLVNKGMDELKKKGEEIKNKYTVSLNSHNVNDYSEWKKQQSKV